MPIFATDLGASGLWLGLIIASFSLSRALFQPVVGNLSDKWGNKLFLLTGLFIYAIIGLCLPLASSVSNLIFIRVIHGVGSAMIVPIAMAYMSSLAPEGHEGRYMSLLNISIFLGIGCGPLLGGVFTDMFTMATAFYSMSLLSLIALAMVAVYMPGKIENTSGVGHIALSKVIKDMVRSRKTCGILLTRMATMIFIVPTMAFIPLLIVDHEFGGGIAIGIVMGGRTLVNAMLQIPFGKLADTLPKEKMLLLSCIATGFFVCLIPLAPNFIMLVGIFVMLGIGEAIIWPVLGAYATEEGREHYGYGSMMGIFNLAMSMGVLTGALISGTAMDVLGLDFAFYISGITLVGLTTIGIWMIYTGKDENSGNEKEIRV